MTGPPTAFSTNSHFEETGKSDRTCGWSRKKRDHPGMPVPAAVVILFLCRTKVTVKLFRSDQIADLYEPEILKILLNKIFWILFCDPVLFSRQPNFRKSRKPNSVFCRFSSRLAIKTRFFSKPHFRFFQTPHPRINDGPD